MDLLYVGKLRMRHRPAVILIALKVLVNAFRGFQIAGLEDNNAKNSKAV